MKSQKAQTRFINKIFADKGFRLYKEADGLYTLRFLPVDGKKRRFTAYKVHHDIEYWYDLAQKLEKGEIESLY